MKNIILVDPLKFIAEYENGVTLILYIAEERIDLGKAIFSPCFYLAYDYRYETNIYRDRVYIYSDYYESLPYRNIRYKYENGIWSAYDMGTGNRITASTLKELELRMTNFLEEVI